MAASNINRVVVSGNLTADPDLRETSSGHTVCELRLANNVPYKKDDKWEQKVNFFQVNTWGGLAKNCEKFLAKGSPVTVDGRLEWQMWEGKDGQTNSRVVIVAENVQFGRRREDEKKDPGKTKDEKGPEDNDDIPF